jgi:SAM-dependent methyltransferase
MVQTGRNLKGRLRLAWGALRGEASREQVDLANRVLRGFDAGLSYVNGEDRPGYMVEPWPGDRPTLTNAREDIRDFYEISRTHLQALGIRGGEMAEIGGSVDANASEHFRDFKYTNIDIIESNKVQTIVMDVCEPVDAELEGRFDFVLSHWVFEHLAAPWVAARNIVRMLKPGGLSVTVTVFAWRYHPVPEDFWRFTPQALSYIFEPLETLDAAFVPRDRRAGTVSLMPNGADRVPVDVYGGWLENWAVYHAGRKPGRRD